MTALLDTEDGFREAFNMFDQDTDGQVSSTELKKMMKTMGDPLTDEEVRDIMRESKSEDGKHISYAAFCKLMGSGLKAGAREHDPEEDMKHAFALFDLNKDGYIAPEELMNAMASLGVSLNEKEVDQLASEATMSSERRISYDVFKKVTQNGFATSN